MVISSIIACMIVVNRSQARVRTNCNPMLLQIPRQNVLLSFFDETHSSRVMGVSVIPLHVYIYIPKKTFFKGTKNGAKFTCGTYLYKKLVICKKGQVHKIWRYKLYLSFAYTNVLGASLLPPCLKHLIHSDSFRKNFLFVEQDICSSSDSRTEMNRMF